MNFKVITTKGITTEEQANSSSQVTDKKSVASGLRKHINSLDAGY